MPGDHAMSDSVCGRPCGQKLIVENNTEKRAVDFQPAVAENESQFPEPIHEKNSPAGGSCQSFPLGSLDLFWVSPSQEHCLCQNERASRSTRASRFSTGIKQLVDQILFVTDIARDQVRYE